MSAMLLYITASNEEEAARIGRTLVEERLCACANVIAPVRSFYRWQGELQDDREAVVIAKTTEDKVHGGHRARLRVAQLRTAMRGGAAAHGRQPGLSGVDRQGNGKGPLTGGPVGIRGKQLARLAPGPAARLAWRG